MRLEMLFFESRQRIVPQPIASRCRHRLFTHPDPHLVQFADKENAENGVPLEVVLKTWLITRPTPISPKEVAQQRLVVSFVEFLVPDGAAADRDRLSVHSECPSGANAASAPLGVRGKENDKARNNDKHPENPDPLLVAAKASKHIIN